MLRKEIKQKDEINKLKKELDFMKNEKENNKRNLNTEITDLKNQLNL